MCPFKLFKFFQNKYSISNGKSYTFEYAVNLSGTRVTQVHEKYSIMLLRYTLNDHIEVDTLFNLRNEVL